MQRTGILAQGYRSNCILHLFVQSLNTRAQSGAVASTPVVAVRLEFGTQSLTTRWADLTFRFLLKIGGNSNDRRIATDILALSRTIQTPWLRGVIASCTRVNISERDVHDIDRRFGDILGRYRTMLDEHEETIA